MPTVPAQVKAGNTSEKLLNEIRQFIYSLYRATEITNTVIKLVNAAIQLFITVIIQNRCNIYQFKRE